MIQIKIFNKLIENKDSHNCKDLKVGVDIVLGVIENEKFIPVK